MIISVLFLLPLVFGAKLQPEEFKDDAGSFYDEDAYHPVDPEHYQRSELLQGHETDKCRHVKKSIWDDECEDFIEKKCFTQVEESCKVVMDKNCTAVVDHLEDRKCFKVEELICQLIEQIHYEAVPETYIVQRCSRLEDRVCDTVYDMTSTTKDVFECVNLKSTYCWEEEKMVRDTMCTYSTEFDCSHVKPHDKHAKCKRKPTKKCYDTPRTITEDICKPRVQKWCEKLTNVYPLPVEKQNCHSEPIKKCELETRTKQKKAKTYSYVKECKPIIREVCEDKELKKLRPVCDAVERQVCDYKPVKQCEEEKRQYCYKKERFVMEKVCDQENKYKE